MPVKILMPALSPTMTEGKLVKWHKAEGDKVESGDVIAEIETDKATMEIESIDDGHIARILVVEGTEHVPVNDVIAVLLEEGEDESSVDKALNSEVEVKAPIVIDEPEIKPEVQETKIKHDNNRNRIIASPLARRLAVAKNIDLATIQGTGPHGRIVKSDIENVSTQVQNPQVLSQQISAPKPSGYDAVDLAKMLDIPHHLEENSGMRRTVASRLLESKQTVPHYYLTIDCELDKLLDVRKEINDAADSVYKLSVNDFIIKASALALKKIPEANVSWTDNTTVIYDRADISIAVAIDGGLITPIVKDADNKSLKAISNEIKDLASRAKLGKLKPEEYQGGTFSLSNLGMFGIKNFSAIINPPQSGILAVGAGEPRAIVKNNELAIATIMTCTASFDHRAIDGAVGAKLLAAFKNYIENPLSLLA